MDFLSADFGMEEGEESDEEEGMSSKAMKHMALQHSEEVRSTITVTVISRCCCHCLCHCYMCVSSESHCLLIGLSAPFLLLEPPSASAVTSLPLCLLLLEVSQHEQ